MSDADAILASLAEVARERQRRAADPALGERVRALKQHQQQRLRGTHADLLASPRYRQSALFFLEELYGPADFVQRDAQFARVVPAITRLFPREVVGTVLALAQLHALSERLDTEMALAALDLPDAPDTQRAPNPPVLDAAAYGRAWRAVGQPAERERQIALTTQIGRALDRHTRSRLLRASLHMMRAPARAAGLEALQHFLESGFDAFGSMGGAEEFLRTIADRERRLAAALFAGGAG
ncbi:MAG: hypothetical protein IPM15_12340 [Betaproteobacteria bacterium]|nr:hypothetical protein [Betaproteobacteria bacterium]MCC6246544.1 hypothetical protein [Rubrivivax sp.]